MKLYENEYSLKRKVSSNRKNSSIPFTSFNLKIIHKITDTLNVSLLVLIIILSALSFQSQREWSKTYAILSRTKVYNNNLIDYISKTEEFYISKLDSLNEFKKTTPKDLIYLKNIEEMKKSFFRNKIKIIFSGFKDSKFQIGY